MTIYRCLAILCLVCVPPGARAVESDSASSAPGRPDVPATVPDSISLLSERLDSIAGQGVDALLLGHLHLRAGNLERAQRYFEDALDRGVGAPAHHGLGLAIVAR